MPAFTKRAEQGFRSCLGIMRLAKPHGPEALEAACERALTIGARSYSSVHSILKMEPSRRHWSERQWRTLHRTRPDVMGPEGAADGPAIQHGNIRHAEGVRTARRPGYFH